MALGEWEDLTEISSPSSLGFLIGWAHDCCYGRDGTAVPGQQVASATLLDW
jgi:hypothetical protein